MPVRSVALLAVIALGACKAEDRGGGPGSGSGDGTDERAIDAAMPDATPPGVLAGTLCALHDLRIPNLCGDADLTEVAVVAQPGDKSDLAELDGDFAIEDADATTDLEIADGDADYHPTRLSIASWRGDDGLLAPMMAEVDWLNLIELLGLLETDGEGSIVVYVVDAGGVPIAGTVLDDVTGASNPPLYGGGSSTAWLEGVATGTRGAVLVVGVPEGDTNLIASKGGASAAIAVPVVAGALTFAILEL